MNITDNRKFLWKNWEICRKEENGGKTFLIKSGNRNMKANETEQDCFF